MYTTNLVQRTFDFAVAVAKMIDQLPNTLSNQAYFRQLARASSSIGANYRATKRAKSTNDFLNKLKIVEEEADEAVYFLELLTALNPQYVRLLKPLTQEGTEILKMIVASIKKVRETQNPKN